MQVPSVIFKSWGIITHQNQFIFPGKKKEITKRWRKNCHATVLFVKRMHCLHWAIIFFLSVWNMTFHVDPSTTWFTHAHPKTIAIAWLSWIISSFKELIYNNFTCDGILANNEKWFNAARGPNRNCFFLPPFCLCSSFSPSNLSTWNLRWFKLNEIVSISGKFSSLFHSKFISVSFLQTPLITFFTKNCLLASTWLMLVPFISISSNSCLFSLALLFLISRLKHLKNALCNLQCH